jgi:Holliday junction resolvase RusA-like endonuclease
MKPLAFFVRGRAATAGSKRGFAIKKGGAYTGRVVMIGDNPREKDWKNAVAAWAIDAMEKAGIKELADCPIRLEIMFVLARPNYHFNSKGQLKPQFEHAVHTTKPDATKMLRCLEDSLKGVVWKDDSQVSSTIVRKRYGPIPGAHVTISEDVGELSNALANIPEVIPQQAILSL